MAMMIRGTGTALFSLSALVAARSAFAAGSAEAAPGVHRPEWVIWAALAAMIFLLILAIALQGRGLKKGGKGGHPYL